MPALNAHKKVLPIPAPIKGINRFAPREAQPELTCWNAVNVLPFDRYGRRRVGQRNGTVKEFSTQIDPTPGPIQAMAQAIAATSSSTLLNETWAYAGGNIQTVSGGNWTVGGGTVNWVASGANSVALSPLTLGGGGSKTMTNTQVWTPTPSISIKFPLTMQAGTTAGDVSTIEITIQDNASVSVAQVFISHQDTGGTPTLYVYDGGTFLGPPFTSAYSAARANANGNWEIDLAPNNIDEAVWTVKLNGTVLATWTDTTTFLSTTSQIKVGGTYNAATGSPALTIGNSLNISTGGGTRLSRLIAVAGGNVWQGIIQGASVSITEASNQASPPLAVGSFPSIATIFQKAYIVDGTSIVQYNILTNAVETYGGAPPIVGVAPTNTTLAASWRSRLVLAGDPSQPQNFFMSRTGVPTDWDYGQTDPSAAVAGNLSTAGQIGEPIVALIPFSDDLLLIGCTHSLWMLEGDPADGGAIVQVSDGIGVLGNNAWVKDPSGELYFLGTGGLFKVKPPWEQWQPPQLLSQESFNQYFDAINQGGTHMSLVWDADKHYLYMFITPLAQGPATHLVFDARTGGLWQLQYPNVQGPTVATQFFADGSASSRTILLGGWDGFIRAIGDLAYDDDGTAISASITFGPFKPFPEAAILSEVTIDFGEVAPVDQGASPTKWNAAVTTNAGPDAYTVTEGTPHNTMTNLSTLERRQTTYRQRLRGGWFTFTVANNTIDTYFAFESASLGFTDAGRNREIR